MKKNCSKEVPFEKVLICRPLAIRIFPLSSSCAQVQVPDTARLKFRDLCWAQQHYCGTLKAQLFRSCLFCGRYGEVIWEVEDTFYWPLMLSRGGHCREVKIRANVWIFRRDDKKWPLQRGGHCREVAVSRGSTVCTLPALNSYALKIVVKTASSNSMTNLALKLKSLGTIFS